VQVNILSASYEARSTIANNQRCVNLYAEKNIEDSKVPVTHYPTPGFSELLEHESKGEWRGIYQSKEIGKKVFGVCGSRLVHISDRWVLTELGVLRTAGRKHVSMCDNGIELLVVDGSPYGYVVDLETLAFREIGENDNFFGGTRVDLIDTYFVVSSPNSANFVVSNSNTTDFDPLWIAGKAGRSDNLAGVITVHRELWLIGTNSAEVWFNAGNPLFPFEIVSGAFIEVGCVAPASICSHGNSILWLSKDDKGQALVAMTQGYKAERVTTRAMEDVFSKFKRIDDAIGMVYQFKGHLFYTLTFPSAKQTWTYDLVENLWHEELWTNTSGQENRIRPSAVFFAYGRLLAGDRENGKLYFLDETNNAAVGGPIKRLKTLPVVAKEAVRLAEPVLVVEMEAGDGPVGENVLTLRYSGELWQDME
jgi:hypothetical protein